MQPANCIAVATSSNEDGKNPKSGVNIPSVVILDNRQQQQQLAVSSSLHYLTSNPQTQQCQQAEKIIMSNSSPIINSSCTTLTTLQPQSVSIHARTRVYLLFAVYLNK